MRPGPARAVRISGESLRQRGLQRVRLPEDRGDSAVSPAGAVTSEPRLAACTQTLPYYFSQIGTFGPLW